MINNIFCIDVNYLRKKIITELLFKSKPKPITPLDSSVYTLNNRTPSYISDETAQARLSVHYSHMR